MPLKLVVNVTMASESMLCTRPTLPGMALMLRLKDRRIRAELSECAQAPPSGGAAHNGQPERGSFWQEAHQQQPPHCGPATATGAPAMTPDSWDETHTASPDQTSPSAIAEVRDSFIVVRLAKGYMSFEYRQSAVDSLGVRRGAGRGGASSPARDVTDINRPPVFTSSCRPRKAASACLFKTMMLILGLEWRRRQKGN